MPQGILNRLCEIYLIQCLRAYFLDAGKAYLFFHSLTNARIRASVLAIHTEPRHNWTLERLAEVSNLSRSVFAKSFTESVGMPPMRYLTLWRMYHALDLISQGGTNLREVAESVGYRSHVAFHKTFTRVHGMTPAQAGL